MAEDKYIIFDTTVEGEVKFLNLVTFRKREVGLLGAVAFLTLCLSITILVVVVYMNRASPFCETADCLSVAAKIYSDMNKTLDPCVDFYKYACQGWTTRERMHPDQQELTVRTGIQQRNTQKLYRLLYNSGSKTGTEAEQKIKQFFRSCIDDYEKMKASGAVFINKVLVPIGGWNVLDNQANPWNFNDALKKVHVDFWTIVLFNFQVSPDPHARDKGVIEIDLGGTGMYWRYYLRDDTAKIRESYKKFMRNVAKLLVRDANRTLDDATQHRIDLFVDDVMKLETQLANVTSNTESSEDPHHQDNRLRIRELKERAPEIDWLSVLSYMFDQAHVTDDTKVVLLEKDYVVKMSQVLQGLGADKQRILNNYFVWRLAQYYATHLSWEYVHANREFYVERTGRRQFLGTWRHCFQVVEYYMWEALSALFVRDHFVDNSKPMVHEVLGYIKSALTDRLSQLDWMDAKTKQKSIDKVKSIVDKVGHPDHLMDDQELDHIYNELVIVQGDYLQNVLNSAKFEKVYWNRMLLEGENSDEWPVTSYSMFMAYYYWWNEMVVPAGILQQPMFDKKYPMYMNFASIGSMMGHGLIHSVDEYGGFYSADGEMEDWWTNHTTTEYEKKYKCISDYYSTKTAGSFEIPGWAAKIPVVIKGETYGRDGIAETGGMRIAYNAYRQWARDNGAEKLPPTIGLTTDQAFFTAYAQTKCFLRRDIMSFKKVTQGAAPEDVVVNGALAQLPEFARAFNCPTKSTMNVQDKCDVF